MYNTLKNTLALQDITAIIIIVVKHVGELFPLIQQSKYIPSIPILQVMFSFVLYAEFFCLIHKMFNVKICSKAAAFFPHLSLFNPI